MEVTPIACIVMVIVLIVMLKLSNKQGPAALVIFLSRILSSVPSKRNMCRLVMCLVSYVPVCICVSVYVRWHFLAGNLFMFIVIK